MTVTSTEPLTVPETPTDRLLTGALLAAPLIYLAADSTYAARGWDDGTGGAVHVLGAIAYGLVALRIAAWLPATSKLAAVILLAGLIGMAGNVAYGFDAIHASFGDTALVERSGAAVLIKPLGLFFPLALALIARALSELGHRWEGAVVLVAAIAWPVAHVGNIAWIALPVNVALVVALGGLTQQRTRRARPEPAARKRTVGGRRTDDRPLASVTAPLPLHPTPSKEFVRMTATIRRTVLTASALGAVATATLLTALAAPGSADPSQHPAGAEVAQLRKDIAKYQDVSVAVCRGIRGEHDLCRPP
jgi:hypothetical protein